MTRTLTRRAATLAAALAAVAAAAGPAAADGLPVLGVDTGSKGALAAGGGVRYVALPVRHDTVVARIATDGGRVMGFGRVAGRYAVPAVAYDGSTGGLSQDGRTLALVRPRVRFPQAHTTLAFVDARSFTLRRLASLRGDFSFDALSPTGATAYLIEYTSPTYPTEYRVRAYDVRAGRLFARPIVDPREPGEAMRGFPITRATSPDGRWAYTLYDRQGQAPFVHALDTARRTARCVDLDALPGGVTGRLRLAVSPDGGTVTVARGSTPEVAIDTRTWRVRTASTAPSDGRGGRPVSVWAILAGVGAVAGVAGVGLGLARRRRAPSSQKAVGTS